MDFYKVIRTLEELLYEVASWLIFYPRTMWRVLVRPADVTREPEPGKGEAPADQYGDAVSPPLLLMLTILIAHGFELGVGARMLEPKTEIARVLVGSDQNLLLLRSVFFSIFPVVAAATLVARRRLALDHRSLRGPFFSQCYLAAPFALLTSVGNVLVRLQPPGARLAGAGLILAGLGWHLWAETGWFRGRLGLGVPQAARLAAWSFLKGLAYFLLLAVGLALLVR
jgi:hypothetical protein